MGLVEQIQNTVTEWLAHPYAKPVLLVALLALALYYYNRSNKQVQRGGADVQMNVQPDDPVQDSPPQAHVPEEAVVLFYSNHCGHCQVLMPVWDKLAAKYQGHPKVMVDKVDCAADKAAGEQFKIEAYPTILKLKPDGTREEYQGARDAESIEQFIGA